MIEQLQRAYASRKGAPLITHVDASIFVRTWRAGCAQDGFCRESCCSHGADVGVKELRRLLSYADALEQLTGVRRVEWFDPEVALDAEFVGGARTRIQAVHGQCSFLDRTSGGCWIHKFCSEHSIDVHELKPMVCCLFPVTFGAGLLVPSDEAEESSLTCFHSGSSLYRGIRSDLLYYFGCAFVSELDGLERARQL